LREHDKVESENIKREEVASVSISPGFDCKKASTSIEKMICSDDDLSRLDKDLMLVYKEKLSQLKYKKEYRKSQAEWLKTKRNICIDISCLKKAYLARFAALERINK
jgi:uncharacterized protein